MSPSIFAGLLCGLGLGLGLVLVFTRIPRFRRSTFAARIAPQLRAGRMQSALLTSHDAGGSFGPLGRILAPFVQDLVRRSSSISPMGDALKKRIARAGLDISVSDFRAQQFLWAGIGLCAALLATILSVPNENFNPLLSLVMVVGFPICGFSLRDWWLGETIARRARKILGQFPNVAELMALSVAAGESTLGSLERVRRSSEGELPDEFGRVLAEVRAGRALGEALRSMADRVDQDIMTRFVDAILVATDRGTPLAQVMRDQAQDVRDAAKRELMETAGKKEVSMLLPVVFGILPLTVIFAVFPGIALFDFSF